MQKLLPGKTLCLLLVALVFTAGYVVGQERAMTQKTVIHAVAWTPTEGFTPQSLEELKQATAVLVQSVPGMQRAWVGKLRQPLTVGNATRSYGLILEFDDLKSREAYSTHPNRAAWAKVWEKVRAPGATVFDVLGE